MTGTPASGGKGFDIVFVSSPFAEALAKLGLAAKLDHSKIPNLKNLYPDAARLGYDDGNIYSVPYAWGTTGLCYRSDLVSGEPDSWNDMLKPKPELAGKITMLSTDRWLLGAGLKALGYSINSTDQAEITAARDLLIEAKKSFTLRERWGMDESGAMLTARAGADSLPACRLVGQSIRLSFSDLENIDWLPTRIAGSCRLTGD